MRRDIPQAVFDSPDAMRAAKLGHAQACADLARLHPSQLDSGNPNHPSHDGIFGYDKRAFMARQYESCNVAEFYYE